MIFMMILVFVRAQKLHCNVCLLVKNIAHFPLHCLQRSRNAQIWGQELSSWYSYWHIHARSVSIILDAVRFGLLGLWFQSAVLTPGTMAVVSSFLTPGLCKSSATENQGVSRASVWSDGVCEFNTTWKLHNSDALRCKAFVWRVLTHKSFWNFITGMWRHWRGFPIWYKDVPHCIFTTLSVSPIPSSQSDCVWFTSAAICLQRNSRGASRIRWSYSASGRPEK